MPDTLGKKEAQQRADRIHAFRSELEHLDREGVLVLSNEQRGRLDPYLDQTLAQLSLRFDVDVSDSQRQISLAMRIASALGGFALCAAVFLFFYRYWGWMSTPLQIVILVAIPMLAVLATDWVARKEKTRYYTSLLALAAFSAFVLNVGVLGSLFNMTPSAGAILAWGLFAIVLGYRYRLKLELAAGLVLLVVFLATIIFEASGGAWVAVTERPEAFLPGALALLFIPVLWKHRNHAGFLPIYRLCGLGFVFVALLILGNEGQMTYLPFSKKAVEGIYQMSAFGAAVAAIWAGLRLRKPECVNLGSAFFAIYLFNRLFVWWWDWMPKYLFFLIIGIIALVLLAVFRKVRTKTAKEEAA